MNQINDEINGATGYANGDKFSTEDQVWNYFTPEVQREMFGVDAVTDEQTLEAWASWVIQHHSHMA